MAEQSLDHDEQINVRWAYDDPNPRAQAMRLRSSPRWAQCEIWHSCRCHGWQPPLT